MNRRSVLRPSMARSKTKGLSVISRKPFGENSRPCVVSRRASVPPLCGARATIAIWTSGVYAIDGTGRVSRKENSGANARRSRFR